MSPHVEHSFAQRTLRNVAWLGSSQALRQGISILATVVLARFLGPSEFGVFAMLIFVNELAQLLVDFGMGSALIQRKEVHPRLLSSCFWINLAVGVSAALLLVVLGPWIAAYFQQPSLRWLLLASGLNLVVAAIMVLPQSLLSRRLAFKQVAIGALIGSTCGALAAVLLAATGAGVWALAAQPLVGGAANMVYLYASVRWLPRWEFDAAEVREVLAFSGQLLGSNILAHVTRNLTSLILGPSLGAAALGLIIMAQTVTWLPIAQFSQAVVRATLPVFAQLQNDMGRFRDGLYRATGVIALLAFPLLTGIGVLADDLMPVVFGAKWVSAAPLVKVLCAFAMVQCVATLSSTALLAAGRGDLLLASTVVGLPVMALALWLHRDGSVMQAVVALVVASIVLQLITLGAALHAVAGRWIDYLRPLVRPLLCSALLAAVLMAATGASNGMPAAVRLVVLSAIGAVVYVGLSLLINREATMGLIGLVWRRGKA